jgi:hypothetical protein
MTLTSTEKELYDYCRNNEFVSAEKIEKYRQRLTEEGNPKSLAYALGNFIPGACTKCDASGMFKWHFLGKLTHPPCSRSWYVPPGTYIGRQMGAVFRAGGEMAGEAISDAEKKGKSGYADGIFSFIMGAIFRFVFAVLMIPIQAAVSLSQKKE